MDAKKEMKKFAIMSARFLSRYCNSTSCKNCPFSEGHLTSQEDPIVYDCKFGCEPYTWNVWGKEYDVVV